MKLNNEIQLNGGSQPILQQCDVTCRCNSLDVQPITLRAANAFVMQHHRHSKPVQGMKFAIGIFCKCCLQLCGVAICGRPVGRKLDDGLTIEANRVCVKAGVSNACSKLYGACARISREMGYSKIVTYILSSEIGTSLRAAGWVKEADNVGGTSWNSSGSIIRTAETVDLFGTYKKYPAELKQRWSKVLRNGR
jgi:hypothetical protein